VFPQLLPIVGKENAPLRMAEDLGKTWAARDVLGYVLIPALETAIGSIDDKLSGQERSSQVRLTTIKDMVEERGVGI
jgi:vacuolar-type H+-ATPase subunit D/Vma8